jgi:uncharacterized membrane protein
MRVAESITVTAPPELVWEAVSDPKRYLHFMSGVTRWSVVGEQETGLGARYRMLLRVGSAEVGGLIEIVEEIPERDLAWTSVTGIDQRGRWRLRERRPGLTEVELRFSYGVAGSGIPGYLSELIAAPILRRRLRSSLLELKRRVEHERRLRDSAQRQQSTAAPAA